MNNPDVWFVCIDARWSSEIPDGSADYACRKSKVKVAAWRREEKNTITKLQQLTSQKQTIQHTTQLLNQAPTLSEALTIKQSQNMTQQQKRMSETTVNTKTL